MKQNIINKIAQDRMVETIVANVAKDTTDEDLADLCQDIYLALMEKDEETIEELYANKQLNFFVTRMIINNIDSSTSRYFYNYKKNKLKQISMDDYKETAD